MRSQAQQLFHQVNSFLCSSANDFENRLLPNDLILLGIKEWIMENLWDNKRVLESQGNMHNTEDVQANSERRSLTMSPTQSLGPPCLQTDVQDVSDL
jgi:hypothetical protein